MAQLLVWQDFKIPHNFTQHFLNDIVNFQSQWTTTVKRTVLWKLCVKFQYRGYQQYRMRMACNLRGNCGDKIVPGMSMMPNCHYYHCKLNFNNCFALSHSPNRVAKKDLVVEWLWLQQVVEWLWLQQVVEWLWLQQSFPKRIGEIVNSCRNSQAIKVHILKGDMFMHFLKENMLFEACLYSSRGTH